MCFRPLTYHFHMLEKEMLRLEVTDCENPKANDLHNVSSSVAQVVLHWIVLVSVLLDSS